MGISLRILETLAESGEEKGVTELARELNSTKARIFRHLQTLRELGYVAQNERTGKNGVGSRLYLLGQFAQESFDLVRAVRPAMSKLRDDTGQTAVFSMNLNREVVVLAIARGTNPVEIGLRLGSSFAPHATAQGKVALAFDKAFHERVTNEPDFQPATRFTITDPAELETAIQAVRDAGWAAAAEETIIGINALAAPVFGHKGRLVGALAIVGSVQFIEHQPSAQQVDQTRACARMASQALGYRAS